jgi:hypothetical protein
MKKAVIILSAIALLPERQYLHNAGQRPAANEPPIHRKSLRLIYGYEKQAYFKFPQI